MGALLALAALALILAACGRSNVYGTPSCITKRGAYIYNWFDVDAINAAEDRIVEALGSVFQDPSIGDRLQGLMIIFRTDLDENGAFQGTKNKVFGEAQCLEGRVDIALSDDNINNTGYAHEISHIIDSCFYDPKARDPVHPGWAERGIWDAITIATG